MAAKVSGTALRPDSAFCTAHFTLRTTKGRARRRGVPARRRHALAQVCGWGVVAVCQPCDRRRVGQYGLRTACRLRLCGDADQRIGGEVERGREAADGREGERPPPFEDVGDAAGG